MIFSWIVCQVVSEMNLPVSRDWSETSAKRQRTGSWHCPPLIKAVVADTNGSHLAGAVMVNQLAFLVCFSLRSPHSNFILPRYFFCGARILRRAHFQSCIILTLFTHLAAVEAFDIKTDIEDPYLPSQNQAWDPANCESWPFFYCQF